MAFDVVLRDPGGGFDVTLTSTSAQNTDAAISAAVALSADLAATKSISGELTVSVAVAELLLDINEIASTAADVQVATSSDLLRTTSIDAALSPSASAVAGLNSSANIQGSTQAQVATAATLNVISGSVRAYTHAAEVLSRDENSPDVQVYTHAAEALSRDTLDPKIQVYTHGVEVLGGQVTHAVSAELSGNFTVFTDVLGPPLSSTASINIAVSSASDVAQTTSISGELSVSASADSLLLDTNEIASASAAITVEPSADSTAVRFIEPALVTDAPYDEYDPYDTDDSYDGSGQFLSGYVRVSTSATLSLLGNDIAGELAVTASTSGEIRLPVDVSGSLPLSVESTADASRTSPIDASLQITQAAAAALERSASIAGELTVTESGSAESLRTVETSGSLVVTASSSADLQRLAQNEIISALSETVSTAADLEVQSTSLDATLVVSAASTADLVQTYDTDAVLAVDETATASTELQLSTDGALAVVAGSTAALSKATEISGSLTVTTTRTAAVVQKTSTAASLTVSTTQSTTLARTASVQGALDVVVDQSAELAEGGVKGLYGSLAVTVETTAPEFTRTAEISGELALTTGLWATDYKPGDVYTIPVGRALETDYSNTVHWTFPSTPGDGASSRAFIPSRKPRPERPYEVAMAEHAREGFLGGVGGGLASPSPVPSPIVRRRALQATASPAMLFYQDSFPVGGTSYKLTFIPIDYSEHAYLKKPSGEHVYQKQGETWEREAGTKNITVYAGMAAGAGDVLVFEYAYYANQPVETNEDVWFYQYKTLSSNITEEFADVTTQPSRLHGATVQDGVAFVTWSDPSVVPYGTFGAAVRVDADMIITVGPVLHLATDQYDSPVSTVYIGKNVVAVGLSVNNVVSGVPLAKFIHVDPDTLISTVIASALSPAALSEAVVVSDGQDRCVVAMDYSPGTHATWVTVGGTSENPSISMTPVVHGDGTSLLLYYAVYWQAWCFASTGQLVSYGGNVSNKLTVYDINWSTRTASVVRDISIPAMWSYPGEGDVIPAATPGRVDILNQRSNDRLELILDCPIDGSAVPSPTLTLTPDILQVSNGPYVKSNWLHRLKDGTYAFTYTKETGNRAVCRYTGPVEYGSSSDVARSLDLGGVYEYDAGTLLLDLGDSLLYVLVDYAYFLQFRSGKNSAEFGPGPVLPAGADDFADAPAIQLPALGAASSSPTNIASFTREPDETDYYISQDWYVNNTAWWSFTPTKTGDYIFHTEWSVPYDEIWWNDTELVVFSGSSLTSLTWEDSDGDSGIAYSSYIYWGVPLTAGTTYHISVGCFVDDFNMAGYRIDVVLSVAWADTLESFT